MIIECIPDHREAEKWASLAEKYKLSFEYNEFFNPSVLDNDEKTKEIIGIYKGLGRDMSNDTMHGAFFDITVSSSDPLIKKASDHRVRQSMEIAARMNLRGVVFHTNYLTGFKSDAYRDSWVEENTAYWDGICREYPVINIYLENMFDESPELLSKVSENLKNTANFGACLDISHAFLSDIPLYDWIEALSPHIRHIHINDNDKIQDLHLAVGSGKIDWNILKEKELYAASPSILIEVTGEEKLVRSCEFLQTINFLS